MFKNSRTTVALGIVAIAAAIVMFASGPLAATQAQAQVMGFGRFGCFNSGFGFHHPS